MTQRCRRGSWHRTWFPSPRLLSLRAASQHTLLGRSRELSALSQQGVSSSPWQGSRRLRGSERERREMRRQATWLQFSLPSALAHAFSLAGLAGDGELGSVQGWGGLTGPISLGRLLAGVVGGCGAGIGEWAPAQRHEASGATGTIVLEWAASGSVGHVMSALTALARLSYPAGSRLGETPGSISTDVPMGLHRNQTLPGSTAAVIYCTVSWFCHSSVALPRHNTDLS